MKIVAAFAIASYPGLQSRGGGGGGGVGGPGTHCFAHCV